MRKPTVFMLSALLAVAVAGASGPVPVSPGDSTDFTGAVSPCPTFSWSAGGTAVDHEVVVYAVQSQVAQGYARPAFEGEPVLRARVPAGALSWTPPSERCLEIGGSYAWTVRALAGGGRDGWSEPALFRVEMGPVVHQIGDALERALSRYLAQRGLDVEAGESVAALIVEELGATRSAEPAGPVVPDRKEVFFMGERRYQDEVAEILQQRALEAGVADPLITSGAPGGTSSIALLDEPELVLDDEYDTAATKAFIAWRSESLFDWVMAVNSDESNESMFILGANAFGDAISFSPDARANFNDAFVLNDFQLNPDDSPSSCSTANDEGKLYWDDSLGQLCGCDGTSWKRVRDGTAC